MLTEEQNHFIGDDLQWPLKIASANILQSFRVTSLRSVQHAPPTKLNPCDAHCCRYGYSYKGSCKAVPDRVKPSFWHPSTLTLSRLNTVWHRMLYSCTHVATVGVKGLIASCVSYVPSLSCCIALLCKLHCIALETCHSHLTSCELWWTTSCNAVARCGIILIIIQTDYSWLRYCGRTFLSFLWTKYSLV